MNFEYLKYQVYSKSVYFTNVASEIRFLKKTAEMILNLIFLKLTSRVFETDFSVYILGPNESILVYPQENGSVLHRNLKEKYEIFRFSNLKYRETGDE